MTSTEERDVVVENPDEMEIRADSSWNSIEPLKESKDADAQTFIILNQEIEIGLEIFQELWRNTKLHIAVDGGADRLLHFCESHGLRISEYAPDYIIGDFDSVSPETLDKYSAVGVSVIYQETQYSTDLMKALSLCNLVVYCGFRKGDEAALDRYDGVAKLEAEKMGALRADGLTKTKIFVIGGIGGRLDQTVHSISILYKYAKSNRHVELFYINKNFEDLILLVPAGENFIKIDTDVPSAKRIVGMLPFGPEVSLTTQGLKWDVRNWSSEISTKVSSSNHLVSKSGFYLKSDRDVVINVTLFSRDFHTS